MEIREKTINLIYTKWNESGPIANGYDLNYKEICNHEVYFNFSNFINGYLNIPTSNDDTRKIKINYVKPEDVKSGEQYFYSICNANLGLLEMTIYKTPIPHSIISLLKDSSKNVSVIFCREHESELRFGIEFLIDKFRELNINENKLIFVNNNSRTQNQLEKYNSSSIAHKSNFIDFSSSEVISKLDTKYKKDRKFLFLCKNKKPKYHRLCTLAYLHSRDILNQVNWSFIPNDELDKKSLVPYLKLFSVEDLKFSNLKYSVPFVNNVFKYDYYEKREWFNENGDFQHQNDFDQSVLVPDIESTYENSYINIVTESHFASIDNIVHVTEKSLRPFFNYQIPLFVATPYHLKDIRERYQLDMFDDFIDHSYDLEENDKKRFEMVMSEVNRLAEIESEVVIFFKNNKDRFEKNRMIMINLYKEHKKKDMDFFYNLIESNEKVYSEFDTHKII